MTTSTSRRAVLAGIAAVPAIAIGGAPASAAVSGAPDPIFNLIFKHSAAHDRFVAAVDRICELEVALPPDRRRSLIAAWECSIVDSDDPRWIAAELERDASSDAETDAAIELLNVRPTTIGGLIVFLAYAHSFEARGEQWPDHVIWDHDDKHGRDWKVHAFRHAAEALFDIAQPSAVQS